jgi:hypothetical protein
VDRWRIVACRDRPHLVAISWCGGRQEYASDDAIAVKDGVIVATAGTVNVRGLFEGPHKRDPTRFPCVARG